MVTPGAVHDVPGVGQSGQPEPTLYRLASQTQWALVVELVLSVVWNGGQSSHLPLLMVGL